MTDFSGARRAASRARALEALDIAWAAHVGPHPASPAGYPDVGPTRGAIIGPVRLDVEIPGVEALGVSINIGPEPRLHGSEDPQEILRSGGVLDPAASARRREAAGQPVSVYFWSGRDAARRLRHPGGVDHVYGAHGEGAGADPIAHDVARVVMGGDPARYGAHRRATWAVERAMTTLRHPPLNGGKFDYDADAHEWRQTPDAIRPTAGVEHRRGEIAMRCDGERVTVPVVAARARAGAGWCYAAAAVHWPSGGAAVRAADLSEGRMPDPERAWRMLASSRRTTA